MRIGRKTLLAAVALLSACSLGKGDTSLTATVVNGNGVSVSGFGCTSQNGGTQVEASGTVTASVTGSASLNIIVYDPYNNEVGLNQSFQPVSPTKSASFDVTIATNSKPGRCTVDATLTNSG